MPNSNTNTTDTLDMDQIKKLEAMRKNFVANVSHELKTPITLITGFLETLLGGAMHNKDELVEFLQIIQKHAHRLDAIIDDLLSLSRIEQEHDNESIDKGRHSLNEVIKKAMGSCEEKALKKDISLSFSASETICATINPSLIEQAIINLSDNAIKYSPEGSKVQLSLSQTDTHIAIQVKDEGKGIPDKHIPHLFERFYRVDKARSREMGGTGLGLAIVKHIAQAHNGSVHVESTLDSGSVFSIHLPTLVNNTETKP